METATHKPRGDYRKNGVNMGRPRNESIGAAHLRARNEAAGGYYFSPNTMRFFGSKVHDVFQAGPGFVFITSEDNFDRTKRGFAVRVMLASGKVESLTEINAFKTRRPALQLARQWAAWFNA